MKKVKLTTECGESIVVEVDTDQEITGFEEVHESRSLGTIMGFGGETVELLVVRDGKWRVPHDHLYFKVDGQVRGFVHVSGCRSDNILDWFNRSEVR